MELWAISNIFEIGIKKIRNKNLTTIIVFTNLYIVITKIFEPKIKLGIGAIRDFIY